MANPILENQLTEEQEETYNTSEPQAVNKARKKAARTRADRLKFIAAAMSHEEGRGWFYDLLVFCKLWDGEFRDSPTEAAFMLGRRNVGLRVLDDIQTASPNEYMTMINENRGSKA